MINQSRGFKSKGSFGPQRPKFWGAPYHGKVEGTDDTDGALILPTLATIPMHHLVIPSWVNPLHPFSIGIIPVHGWNESRLIKRPGWEMTPRSVEEAKEDVERGYQWRDYALAVGVGRFVHGFPSVGLGYYQWIYFDGNGDRFLCTLGVNEVTRAGMLSALEVAVKPFGTIYARDTEIPASRLITLDQDFNPGFGDLGAAPPGFPTGTHGRRLVVWAWKPGGDEVLLDVGAHFADQFFGPPYYEHHSFVGDVTIKITVSGTGLENIGMAYEVLQSNFQRHYVYNSVIDDFTSHNFFDGDSVVASIAPYNGQIYIKFAEGGNFWVLPTGEEVSIVGFFNHIIFHPITYEHERYDFQWSKVMPNGPITKSGAWKMYV
jgi:hypothetical protein